MGRLIKIEKAKLEPAVTHIFRKSLAAEVTIVLV